MRNPRWLVTTSGLLLSGAALHSGCGRDAANCDVTLTCAGFADAGRADIDPICAGEPMGKDAGPAGDCGVFASPTAPAGGDGFRASPFNTLQAALDRAATTSLPVFACGKPFAENVHVAGGVVLYGGLDCDEGWVWTAGKPTESRRPPAPGRAGARSRSCSSPGAAR